MGERGRLIERIFRRCKEEGQVGGAVLRTFLKSARTNTRRKVLGGCYCGSGSSLPNSSVRIGNGQRKGGGGDEEGGDDVDERSYRIPEEWCRCVPIGDRPFVRGR